MHKHFIYLHITATGVSSFTITFCVWKDEATAIFTLLSDHFVIHTQNYLPNLLLQFEI